MPLHTEKTFETAIVESLTEKGGWLPGSDKALDRSLALFPLYIIEFLQASQPKQWEKLSKIHSTDVETKLIQRLCKELELRGTLDIYVMVLLIMVFAFTWLFLSQKAA